MATNHPPASGRPSLARVILTARMEERLIAPFRRNPVTTRILFVVSVVVVLGLHGLALLYLLHRDQVMPPKAAEPATAVEVVVEPPPPPPKEQPASRPTIEKPASSAPRAANEAKVETEQNDTETRAPKAPSPPTDGKPEPAPEAKAPDTPPQPEKTQAEAAKPDEPKDAEALDKATPDKTPDPKPAKTAKPPVKTHAAKTALQQLSGTSALPDYKFAKPTKKSPVSGGTEDARYLAIVYGLVMRHFHPGSVAATNTGAVTLTFEVDGDGTILGVDIQQRSGDDRFDAAAMAAVNRASPLPPPPSGAPHGLIARIPTSGQN